MALDASVQPGRSPRNTIGTDLASDIADLLKALDSLCAGDFSVRLEPREGQLGQVVERLNDLAVLNERRTRELVRASRVIGREGRMTERLDEVSADGDWGVGAEAVNSLIDDLVRPTTEVARVIAAVAEGDLSQKMALEIGGQPVKGEFLSIGMTVNTMVDQLSSFADEVTRVAREVGTEGRLGGQAQVKGVSGTWRDLTDNVNYMAANLTGQVRNIAQVATAVAKGDLSQKINVHAQGEILELKSTVNTMVDQLSSFADEVTRVAREVGTEGKLGGQAQVKGVSGTWRDLTDNVNGMASNLTSQVRNIALVTTAVAQGDLSQKITVDAQGEILELKSTVNTMVDQLSAFAAEVTRVAREVGTEGRLGGQAEVAGVSGTWRHLTENVNQLAGNLTTQVRAIAEVSTAVTRGDLTRSITVEASGEVAELKDNINQMIANLRSTTEINAQQDWLKSNLARIGGRMQGQRDLQAVTQMIMSEVTPVVEAVKGAFYLVEAGEDGQVLRLAAGYGVPAGGMCFALGEGLVGQAAADKRSRRVREVPPDYLPVRGGLGEARPADVFVLPVLFEEQVLGVIELASFGEFSDVHTDFLLQLVESIGVVLNTIIANVRTEALLEQSQGLAQELQVQSVELQRTNAELEEKAEQLEMASQYKSEFLANMSHELRTPLNSLLILAQLLIDNPSSTLTAKEVEFARTIYSAGSDLLDLINDILDLSKVEAGKMELHPAPILLSQVGSFVESTFRPLAQQKGLEFVVDIADDLPASITTDEQRLQQVVKNLLSNAIKFTERGRVTLSMFAAPKDLWHSVPTLDNADTVVALSVSDTGVGVPAEKLGLIFEEFQQGDGTTSRKYGGTGLGLSISRNITRLLGGAIAVESAEGVGSTFTIYVPADFPFEIAEAADPPTGPVRLPKVPMLSRALRAPVELGVDDPLRGATVLIVDDDVRNVFALTSALEMHGMSVLYADNGRAGIELLQEHGPAVDLMLMDVMMPEMDGNETTEQIRQKAGFANLPILFLTAKAMPGDRDKSLHAGASDYITKPVDLDKLLTVMRSWLVGSAESGQMRAGQ